MPDIEDVDDRRFIISENGETAELVYRRQGNRLILEHTGVPSAWAGRGIGGRLVHASVERARTDGLVVVPVCSFARRWLEQHPEVADQVTIDWDGPPNS